MLAAMKSKGNFVGEWGRKGCLAVLFSLFCTWGFSVNAVDLLSARNAAAPLSPTGNADSAVIAMSPDGRFVLLSSTACDLVTNDNARWTVDVFVRDRVANRTVLASPSCQVTGGAEGDSIAVGISTNGRYALFESLAADHVVNDTNGVNDVFVRDLQTQTTLLVSVATNGAVGSGGSSNAVMTPDGRFVAFVSSASNLVAGDTNGGPDLFLRDLQNQTTTMVSVGATNMNGKFGSPVITPDGRWVAFFSNARGMVVGITNISQGEIYLRDMTTGAMLWPSSNAIGLVRSVMTFNSVPVPTHPVISADGRYVAFSSGWTNGPFAPPNGTTPSVAILQFDATTLTTTIAATNGLPPSVFDDEIFGPEMTPDGQYIAYAARVTNGVSAFCSLRRWDRATGTNVLVSGTTNGVVVTNSMSLAPVFSSDGRYLVFVSDAPGLVTNQLAAGPHIYRRDLVANTTELVDVGLAGSGLNADHLFEPAQVSPDGRLIAFSSYDGDLVVDDTNGGVDAFIRDATTGTTELVSKRNASVQSVANNIPIVGPISQSGSGQRVAFATSAADVWAGDTNKEVDVFVWDAVTQTNLLVSVGLDGQPARGGSFYPQISQDGRYVLFSSTATNLVVSDTNVLFDVYRRDLETQQTILVSATTNGTSLSGYDVSDLAITPDARVAVFTARTNSGANHPLFWRDLVSGDTRQIASNVGYSRTLMVSADGQRVAYIGASTGNLLIWDATNGNTIYNTPGAVGAVSLAPSGNRVLYQGVLQSICYDLGAQSNIATWLGVLSFRDRINWGKDERFVAFSTSSALISSDTNATTDVYLVDLSTDTRSLISSRADGSGSGNAASDGPMISADGRVIAYRSLATDLLASPTSAPGLFLFDLATGSNQLFLAKSAIAGMSWFSAPQINSNGTLVVFRSVDGGLVPGDNNRGLDAFANGFSVMSTVDTDADGIPDWWMVRSFGHANGQSGDLSRANDDADGDGLTNGQEFLAGTDPTNSESELKIQITQPLPMITNVVLSWPGRVGKNYRVQFSDEVGASNWQNLSVPIQVMGGQAGVTASRTNGARVFRVRVEP